MNENGPRSTTCTTHDTIEDVLLIFLTVSVRQDMEVLFSARDVGGTRWKEYANVFLMPLRHIADFY